MCRLVLRLRRGLSGHVFSTVARAHRPQRQIGQIRTSPIYVAYFAAARQRKAGHIAHVVLAAQRGARALECAAREHHVREDAQRAVLREEPERAL